MVIKPGGLASVLCCIAVCVAQTTAADASTLTLRLEDFADHRLFPKISAFFRPQETHDHRPRWDFHIFASYRDTPNTYNGKVSEAPNHSCCKQLQGAALK